MSTKSKIDQQLEKILTGDIDSLLDGHSDGDESNDTIPTEELVPVVFDPVASETKIDSKDKLDDYNFARSNLYGLVGRTNAALELALKLAAMSEHPRALEVIAVLIKTSGDVSKDIVNLHRELVEKRKPEGGTGGHTQINNYYKDDRTAKDIEDMLNKHDDNKTKK